MVGEKNKRSHSLINKWKWNKLTCAKDQKSPLSVGGMWHQQRHSLACQGLRPTWLWHLSLTNLITRVTCHISLPTFWAVLPRWVEVCREGSSGSRVQNDWTFKLQSCGRLSHIYLHTNMKYTWLVRSTETSDDPENLGIRNPTVSALQENQGPGDATTWTNVRSLVLTML